MSSTDVKRLRVHYMTAAHHPVHFFTFYSMLVLSESNREKIHPWPLKYAITAVSRQWVFVLYCVLNGFAPLLSSQGHQKVFFQAFGTLIYLCSFIHIPAFMSHISRFHYKTGLSKEAMDLDGSSSRLRVKDTHARMLVMWHVHQRWCKILLQAM